MKEKEQREEGQGGTEETRGNLRAAIQCMAHKSEINRMFIEQLCAAAISASMLPSSSTSRSNRSRRRHHGLCTNCDCNFQTLTNSLKQNGVS